MDGLGGGGGVGGDKGDDHICKTRSRPSHPEIISLKQFP